MGLRWSDVDLEARSIHVRQSATVVAYELRIADVKTSYGRRTIDVTGDVVDALRGGGDCMQLEERLLVGNAYEDHDLVFARAGTGSPPIPSCSAVRSNAAVGRSGLPIIRLHHLRHTHATLLLKAGVPVKVVSERLGHATASFTLDVYGWVLPGMQAEAAAVFSRLMSADPVEDPVEEASPQMQHSRGSAL